MVAQTVVNVRSSRVDRMYRAPAVAEHDPGPRDKRRHCPQQRASFVEDVPALSVSRAQTVGIDTSTRDMCRQRQLGRRPHQRPSPDRWTTWVNHEDQLAGGALPPVLSPILLSTCGSWAITAVMAGVAVLSLASVLLLGETAGRGLGGSETAAAVRIPGIATTS